jgi:predicted ATPase
VADPTLVVASITRALHVEARDPVLDALKELFRSRRALLVLDNFEQVLDAAFILRELLADAPGLRILATSREPMRVTGEVQFDLSPLTADAAVELFTERAASNSATYSDDQTSVEELCGKLDNLPLAIELVAARARLFSPERLLQLVNGSLLDLAAKRRDVPDKQRSLRAAIDWSYQLLAPAEQRLFRRLSVFAGGWTITDSWQVLTSQEITELRFAHELEELLDKRLLRVATDGTRRFDMLETLREYARECLDAEPAEADTVRHAHAEHWLAAAEAAHPDPLSRRQTACLRALEPEQDNLHAALARLIDTHDAASALRMAAACGRSWWSRDCAGGLARISDVLCLPNLDSPVRQRAVVLLWRGRLAIRLGRLRAAERDITECLALAEHQADPELEASAAADLALVQMERCEWDEAAALLLRARELYERHPYWTGLADLIDNLGVLATGRGDFAGALQLLTESHQLYDRDADESGAAWVDNDLARVYLALGDTAAAGRLATSAYQSGLRQGDPQLVCWARNYLGLAASSRGAYGESLEHHSESLAAAMLLSDHRPEALALEGFAALRSNEGRHEEAVTLAAAANAHRRRYELPRTAADRSILEPRLARSQAALRPSLVSTLTAAGDALTLEQAAILARRG